MICQSRSEVVIIYKKIVMALTPVNNIVYVLRCAGLRQAHAKTKLKLKKSKWSRLNKRQYTQAVLINA